MFDTVLVANRGEIACRVIRTLRELGIRAVAVYTESDHGAKHVGLADTAVLIHSYLDTDEVAAVATATGSQAVHPGYGFLSENVDFARALDSAGIVFIGPGLGAIETMADKIRAKEHVAARGVPVIPGAGDATARHPSREVRRRQIYEWGIKRIRRKGSAVGSRAPRRAHGLGQAQWRCHRAGSGSRGFAAALASPAPQAVAPLREQVDPTASGFFPARSESGRAGD